MRQVLLEGLVLLAGDTPAMDELFDRVDTLYGSTALVWADDMRRMLKALLLDNPTAGGLRVGIGEPTTEAVLPFISIVPDGGHENEDESNAGQLLSTSRKVVGVPNPDDPTASTLSVVRTEGVGWVSEVVIGSWSRSVEQALLMHAVVRHVLFLGRGQLQTGGVHQCLFSDSGFTPSKKIFPEPGYVPTLRVSLSWTLRASRFISPVPSTVTSNTGNGMSTENPP